MFYSGLSRTGFQTLVIVSGSLAGVSAASAHDAPTGWEYPYACCSGLDCRPVSDKQISERPEGFVINNTGEVIANADTRLRNSPDGEYHWCSVAGGERSRTICLFVPPRGY